MHGGGKGEVHTHKRMENKGMEQERWKDTCTSRGMEMDMYGYIRVRGCAQPKTEINTRTHTHRHACRGKYAEFRDEQIELGVEVHMRYLLAI